MLLKFILLHYGAFIILNKHSFYSRLKALAQTLAKSRFKWLGRFFYELAECVFCSYHFAGVLMLPLYALFWGFYWEILLFPLISTAAIFLLKTGGKWE